MYKETTLNNFINEMRDAIAEYIGCSDSLKISITNGNVKIGKTMNVSLPAVIACGNCSACKYHCYDIKASIFRETVLKARARNYALLVKDRDEYFKQIAEKCRRRRTNLYFRWHVSGEIIDADYFERMVKIAIEYPAIKFWTYTKMYSIVNRYVADGGFIPENLIVMFSEWRGMVMDNPYSFPEFRVLFENETAPAGAWICPGNCDICKAADRGCIVGETTYNGIH